MDEELSSSFKVAANPMQTEALPAIWQAKRGLIGELA
jgi:hypothetical protein